MSSSPEKHTALNLIDTVEKPRRQGASLLTRMTQWAGRRSILFFWIPSALLANGMYNYARGDWYIENRVHWKKTNFSNFYISFDMNETPADLVALGQPPRRLLLQLCDQSKVIECDGKKMCPPK